MKSSQVKKHFIDFFKSHNHQLYPSSSLIPHEDPSLLFVNAGMNQFKDVFLDKRKIDHKNLISVQKCLRAGGKHNDLENVGYTDRHHTFFEMLGSFSFGDYFKQKAILLSWEWILSLNLEIDRLYVSVYKEDLETAQIWKKEIGVKESHILFFDEKENFWRMGETGPCGPCTEIYYQTKESSEKITEKNLEKYCIEFWNLVFMQFYENEKKEKIPLKRPCVDTGMGLERMSMILQKKQTNYETDLFYPLIQTAETLSNKSYQTDKTSFQVIADHSRAISFLMSDGVTLSNEGRGYVLRRILRRAVRYEKKLSSSEEILEALIQKNIEIHKEFYPSLFQKKDFILSSFRQEKKRFLQTLDQGLNLLEKEMSFLKTKKQNNLSKEVAFKLYDTYGFPIDLTRMICKEKKCLLDEKGFYELQEQAKKRSQKRSKQTTYEVKDLSFDEIPKTNFSGEKSLKEKTKIIYMLDEKFNSIEKVEKDQKAYLILEKTPFYAESGGQVGDQGIITDASCKIAEILDCQKKHQHHLHYIRSFKDLKLGQDYFFQVNSLRRKKITAHHSSTHLLHHFLRKILGTHVEQLGSLVNEEKTRFDFSHPSKISWEKQKQIEKEVQKSIQKKTSTKVDFQDYKAALKQGALALFAEKYENPVRVLSIGESKELCGGTHISNTQELLMFKIVQEKSVSSGVRRLTAYSGIKACYFSLCQLLERALIIEKYQLSLKSEFFKSIFKRQKDVLSGKFSDLNLDYFLSFENDLMDLEQFKDQLQLSQEIDFKVCEESEDAWKISLDSKTPLMKKLEDYEFQKTDLSKILCFKDLIPLMKKKKKLKNKQSFNLEKDSVLKKIKKIGKFNLFVEQYDISNIKDLADLSDELSKLIPSSIILVQGKKADKSPLVLKIDSSLRKNLCAKELFSLLIPASEGKGGGHSGLAQGVVFAHFSLEDSLERLYKRLKK